MVNFHMACIYRHIVLVVFLYATAIYCQDCDPGFLWVEDVPSCCGAPAQHCFYETDLNILQEMIDNSIESGISNDCDENNYIEGDQEHSQKLPKHFIPNIPNHIPKGNFQESHNISQRISKKKTCISDMVLVDAKKNMFCNLVLF